MTIRADEAGKVRPDLKPVKAGSIDVISVSFVYLCLLRNQKSQPTHWTNCRLDFLFSSLVQQ